MNLANKALLANLHISQWTGRKQDKKATGTVEKTYKTETKVGQYTKKLLPGAKELEEVSRLAGAIRAHFYEQTLPWFADGSRIIKSTNYMTYLAEFRVKKGAYEGAVDRFLEQYPRLRDEARAKLGRLFRDGEYPSTADLKHYFKCEIAFMPMPDVKDFRTEILDSEKDAFVNRMKSVEAAAIQDCWTRLHDVVTKAQSKLGEKDAIFRDSLIENINNIVELLPRLNVTDDPKLEDMRKELAKVTATISPEICRKSEHARKDAANKLDEITDKMAAFMGS